jgi:hypothetical protein
MFPVFFAPWSEVLPFSAAQSQNPHREQVFSLRLIFPFPLSRFSDFRFSP